MDERPDEASLGKAYTAGEITVYYERARCRHYAECVRGLPDVFDPGRRPWIRAELADGEQIAEVVRRCPTGALHYRLASGKPERPLEPTTRLEPFCDGTCGVNDHRPSGTREEATAERGADVTAQGRQLGSRVRRR